MCEICKRFICPPACPSYDGRSAEHGRRIAICRACGEELYADSDFFTVGHRTLCSECRRAELMARKQTVRPLKAQA